MKNRLLKLMKMASKGLLYGIMLQCFFFSFLWAEEGNAQVESLDKTYVHISKQQLTVKQLLEEVEKETSFHFVYTKDLVRNEAIALDKTGRLSVSELLLEISKKTALKFKQVNETIYLGLKDKQIEKIIRDDQQVVIQTRNITGKVTSSEDGEGLPGVNVVEKGTSNGTVTDVQGNYSLEVSEGATLVFSSVGYTPEEVEVGNRSVIDLAMVQDIQQLQELVVIGYGEREKRDVTGAISQIDSKEIQKSIPAMSPEMAMQGQMAGVFVSNPGSDPTGRPNIRIRGVSSLEFNDPLYVVDGIPIYEGGAANTTNSGRVNDLRGPINIFSLINPNDIESISVLKDASATAIYGVRASNGVVLITTKRGSEGKAKVSLSASYGVQNVNQRYDVVGVQDYVALSREAWANNENFDPDDDDFFKLYDETSGEYLGNSRSYTQDWLDAAIQDNAVIQNYSMNVSGGNKNSTYALGGGYSSQEDVMFRNKFERYSLFVNSDHNLSNWLKVGESLRLVYSKDDRNGGGELNAAFVPPWQPMFNNENTNGLQGYAFPGRDIDGEFFEQGYGNGTNSNFRGDDLYSVSQRKLFRTIGSVYAQASFKGFRVRGTYSVDYINNMQDNYSDAEVDLFAANRGFLDPNGNTYRRRIGENINTTAEFLVGYNATINNHKIDVILNAMDQRLFWNNTQMGWNQNTALTGFDQRRIDDGPPTLDQSVFFERTPRSLLGYMGRISYNYDSKYYVDATVRVDGSSNFAPGYKWGTFPSFALAWRISSEPFMANLNWLSDLKIRGGWGQTGNQETRAFSYLSLVTLKNSAQFGTGAAPGIGIRYIGAYLGDFPSRDLSWETVSTTSLGFDSEILDGKITLTAEYYYRFTDGIIQQIDVPSVIGNISQPVTNLAQVSNQGIELQGSYRDKIGELGYNASFNFTTVDNNVEKIYQGIPTGGNTNRITEGNSINHIFGYKTDGIFQSQQEVDDWLTTIGDPGNDAQKSAGDVIFQDLYGAPEEGAPVGVIRSDSPDNVINGFDRTYLGRTIPGYYYGVNLGLDYKGFDLYLNFRGLGNVQKVFRGGLESISGGGGNYLTDYLNRWTPENTNTNIPRAVHEDPSGNNRFSDRFVHDAGFFRFQNFQVGYNFSSQLLSKVNASNLRVYFSGANIFVLSPFPDLDPENITTPTTFTLGLNLGF